MPDNVIEVFVNHPTIELNTDKIVNIIDNSVPQVNSDWNATNGLAEILNKPDLATVATSGSYNDLGDIPYALSQFNNDVGFLTSNVITSVAGKTGDVSLDSSDVGLGNVANVDTTNPENINQNSTYRFVTDTEKGTWNGKQSALGFTPFNKTGDTLTATNGTGLIGLPAQSAIPATPSSGFSLFATSSNALSWIGQNGFTRTFDGTANTANRVYTLPNASGTIAIHENIPSGAIIGGVCHIIYTPTIGVPVPQTRPTSNGAVVGGAALVIGDKWYNPSTGVTGFWHGTYWLGLEAKSASYAGIAYFSSNLHGYGGGVVAKGSLIFIESAKMVWAYANYNSSNYWRIQVSLQYLNSSGVSSNIVIVPTYNTSSGVGTYSLQTNLTLTSSILYIRGWVEKIGSPGSLVFSEGIMYREVYL